MYPSKQDQLFGVFVKQTINVLEGLGANFTKKIVIRGKRNNLFKKSFTYLEYYFQGIITVFNNKEDLVYIHFLTHNLPLIWWYKKMQKKPLVINLHGSDINKVKKNSTLDIFQAKTLNIVDEIIVPSVYFRDILKNRYPKFKKKFFIYPSGGIDLDIFKPKEINSPKLIISFVSRIDKGKGWEDFLKIINQLNAAGIDAHAIIAGDGKEKPLFIKALNNHRYKNKIEFRGFQSKERLAEIYQCSEIFVFPTRLAESLGLVGLEAMACQNIIFARNIGGATGYIKSGDNGFLFNSTEEAVQQIKEYLTLNEQTKKEIKTKALNTSQEYESKKVALDLFNNFQELCSKN